jgi:hypothetical protein
MQTGASPLEHSGGLAAFCTVLQSRTVKINSRQQKAEGASRLAF